MTEQTPEIVAAVDVSPVSPKPVHIAATSPALVPSLQDHAATLDVAYLDSLTTAPFPFVTMPATSPANPANPSATTAEVPKSSPASDTIVVRGDEESPDDGSQEGGDEAIDDESLDAYGEDDDEQQDVARSPQASHVAHVAESATGAGIDTEAETAVAQPDVTEASSESMINTPSSTSSQDSNVVMKSESPTGVPSHPTEPERTTASLDASSNPPDVNQSPKPESQTIVDSSAAASDPTAAADISATRHEEDSIAVDIQKLVDDITARAVESSSSAALPTETTTSAAQAPPETTASPPKQAAPSLGLPQPSSLPPKPVIPEQAGQPGSRPEDFHPFQSRGSSNSLGHPPMSMQGVVHSHAAPNGSISYVAAAAAPGTAADGVSSLPPIPPTSFNSGSQPYAPLPNVPSIPGSDASQRQGLHGAQLQQAWETFQADEKRYMTEAKWERFPDNSRIFIGNLSSERVSKREVFELFHRFGRLAQISLKSAYGFVQYHSAEDAEAAMQAVQGAELGGRKIHLEFSRTQKKKEPQERDQRERSPDRRSQRGVGVRGGLDRYDGRERDQVRRRGDYRPGRSPSPRRDDAYGRGGRDRHHGGRYDRSSRARSRSRSPRFGRFGQDSYRRRSPSPRGRGPPEPSLDMPQRYGEQVPDVQLLLLEEVQRDFVSWVQRAFYERGMKADVMYFNPRFSRDSVLQRLVVEGVHGVIELDLRAQTAGKIPLQVFARSAGSNVRFDQYQDLEPRVAAELVLRAKQSQVPPALPQQPAYAAYPPNPYPQYPQAYPPPQGPPAGYPYAQPPPVAPPAPGPISIQDIAGMAGHVDNNTLQALLASLSAGQQAPHAGGMPPAAPGTAQQVDINALLGSLKGAGGAASAPPAHPAYGMPAGYMPQMNGTPVPPAPPGAAGGGGGDTAQQVQNIMATLARHR